MKKKKTAIILTLAALTMPQMVWAEDALTVSQKNFLEFEGDYSNATGYFFAKLENTSEEAIAVGDGALVAFNEAGEILLTAEYINTSPSSTVLEPGSYIYVNEYIFDTVLEENSVSDYKFSVTTKKDGNMLEQIPCEATYEIAAKENGSSHIYVTFTNPTDEPKYDIYISAALHDADGNLVFADTECGSGIALHPQSTITVEMTIDGDLTKYYKEKGIEPVSVDAMVYYEVE